MSFDMLDTFVGVPEFYADKIGVIEDAGNGMVRTVCCIERHGVLIPVFSLIKPACKMLEDAPRFSDMARRIAMGRMMAAH